MKICDPSLSRKKASFGSPFLTTKTGYDGF